MGKYDGDTSKFRDWLSEVIVVVGQLDRKLSDAVKHMVEKDNLDKAEDIAHRAHEDIPRVCMRNLLLNCMAYWHSTLKEVQRR